MWFFVISAALIYSNISITICPPWEVKWSPVFPIFTESAPMVRFSHRVAMSVCLSVCLDVCLRHRVQEKVNHQYETHPVKSFFTKQLLLCHPWREASVWVLAEKTFCYLLLLLATFGKFLLILTTFGQKGQCFEKEKK